MQTDDFPLCRDAEAPALWRDERCRVVSASDADYPGFLRVIWQAHVREMTDLEAGEQQHLLRVVLTVERVLRAADVMSAAAGAKAAANTAGAASGTLVAGACPPWGKPIVVVGLTPLRGGSCALRATKYGWMHTVATR